MATLEDDPFGRQKAQKAHKEMVEAVSGCVEQMKAELLQKLQRIMDPSGTSLRRPGRASICHRGSKEPKEPKEPRERKESKEPPEKVEIAETAKIPEIAKEFSGGSIPAEPTTPVPTALPVNVGFNGPRASPALKEPKAIDDSEEMYPGESQGLESISMAKVLSPRQIDNVQDAIYQHRSEHQTLRLHKAWKLDDEPRLRGSTSHSTSNSFLRMGSNQFSGDGMRRSGSNKSKDHEIFHWYDRLTVSHRSPFCMVWDIWTSIAIAYDMVMTPMDAFNIQITPVVRALERTSSITWLVDMVLSFVRSYGKLNGTEERHLMATAKNYLRTWFAFDFTLVCLDMFIFILEDTSWMRYMSFLRAVRLFRLLRVLRVAKVKARIAVLAQLLHILQTQRITDRGFLMLNIAKSLLVVTVINHFTACIWYAIATILEVDENNWVHTHFADPDRPDSLIYLYTTAYHWSITQLTPASCEIYPSSARERIFNIAVILFGLCVFSSFISSMGQQLHALQQLNRADRHRMSVLRRFISEHQMSVTLARTIVDFVRQKRGPQTQRPLKISDIEMFNNFPTVLLQKIRSEAYFFVLSKHSFFKTIYDNEREVFIRLCNNTIFEESVDKGHMVFNTGDEGQGMYFLYHGKLAYAHLRDDVSFDPTSSEDFMMNMPETNVFVTNSGFIAEVAMWLHWFHRGALTGDAIVTDMLFVSVERFREVIRQTLILKDVRLYARLYALRALRAGKEGVELHDLWHEDEVIEEISKLSLQGGLEQAVNILAAGRITPQKILRAWRQETQSGRFKRRLKSPMSHWRRFMEWVRCCFSPPTHHDYI